ncbi:ATP-binding protein [Plantactinospora sp. DSM 117369]
MTRAVGHPPQPDETDTIERFIAALRQLRLWSGLTYRQLAERARKGGDSLPASTVATALHRTTLPKRDTVEMFVRACGLDQASVAAWVAARDALAVDAEVTAVEPGSLAPPAPRPDQHEQAEVRAAGWTSAGYRVPPWGSKTLAPCTLPPDVPDFSGRAAESRLLLQNLKDGRGATPITVIAGMGGVGKTSLAVHVAHLAAASFPDGQLYIDLLGAQASPLEPQEVLARFLRRLGVPSRAIPTEVAEASELFRARLAHHRVLLVLDNAVSEEQVRPLLPGTATCAVLITSRNRLTGLEGPLRIDLEVLPAAEALQLLSRVAGEPRVRAELVSATRIVELCGGLPLAVQIAGARLAARPRWQVADLAQRLRDQHRRLDHLVAGDLGVRASLALSYRGLDEETRRLFRLLGLVGVPDFPTWLAAAALDISLEHAEELLEALVDAQLIKSCGSDPAGQQRYRYHDLVRLFAIEESRAAGDDPEAALGRALGAWLWVTERMANVIPGPCYAAISGPAPRVVLAGLEERLTQVDPILWFDAECAALQAVVRQACALDLDDLAFDLAGCMEKYFDVRGMYGDWVTVNTEVMTTCRRAGNRLGEAVMLRGLIDVTTWISEGRTDEAMARLHTEAYRLLEMFTALGHEAGASDAAVMCSWASTAGGDHAAAVETATTALRLAEHANHPGGQIRAHLALAVAHYEQANYEVAATHLPLALSQARKLGNPRCEATVLQFAGIAHRELGMLDSSEKLLTDSWAISRRYQDTYTEVLTMLALARLQLRRGDSEARATAKTSLRLSREFSMDHHLAEALEILGKIEMAEGRASQAIPYLEESVAIWRTRGWRSLQAAALTSLGQAYTGIDRSEARRAFDEARTIYLRLGKQTVADELRVLVDELV